MRAGGATGPAPGRIVRAMKPILLACVLLTVRSIASAQTAGIFDLDRGRSTHAVVTVGEQMPGESGDSPMLRRLAGIAADLRGLDLNRLRACVPKEYHRVGNVTDLTRVFTVHVAARTGPRRVDILQARDGRWVARRILADGTAGEQVRLDREKFEALARTWDTRPATYPAPGPDEPIGQVLEMPKPYTPGRVRVDKDTIARRFMRHSRTRPYPAATRVLSEETLYVRLPRGYDPRSPSGLIVWADPSPDGRPWPQIHPVADELDLICVGAGNAGNDREPVGDRFQLAFDALATVMARYHVDPRRVYMGGMSGGARLSSILLGVYPDVFAGAVPVVGISYDRMLSMGNGLYKPAGFGRQPPALLRLLRTRRIAVITGPLDFNYTEIVRAVKMLKGEGLSIRLDEYEGMSHEMTTPERFADAMRWVDEPYRSMRDAERAEAQRLLGIYTKRFGQGPTQDKRGRDLLVRVTAAGPWTKPAWQAAAWLGAVPGGDPGDPSRD